MRNFFTWLYKSFLIALIVFSGFKVNANHLVGMDLKYTHVSGNTYKITLIAYANCGSATAGSAYDALPTNTPQVYVYNGASLITTLTLGIEAPSTGVEITPVCSSDLLLTQCTNVAYTIPGIKRFTYSTTYTVPGPSSVWRFLFTGDLGGSMAGRALSITNISSTPVTFIQLVDTLNNMTAYNSSPNLSVIPTPFFCLNNNDNYNPGAIDPDGDNLTFFLVDGINGTTSTTAGSPVTYITPYTGTAPLAATTFIFDPATGQIAFYPNALQRSLVVYNIEERRGGTLVGTSQREMTFLVLTCTSTPASGGFTGATNGYIVDSTHMNVCTNSGAFSVNIYPTEPDSLNNITVTYSGLPTGATFTIAGNGTPHPHCVFSWTTTGVTPGTYTFYVTYTDNNCPMAGVQTLAYNITILPSPTITTTVLSAATCMAKAAVLITPGGSSPWVIKVSNSLGDTIQTYTGITGAITDSLTPGTYVITVKASSGCTASSTVVIANPPNMVPTATFTNPSYCGAADGTITLHHLWPGTTDTVKYTYNGTVHAPVVRVVASDSTITLTGLAAGTYTGMTVTYGNCVSTSVSVILTNPSFTMRTLTSVNPSWCGFCDGSITLYGLHPGQRDTINYNLGGVAQPPVVLIIPLDSQVVMTGLCAGTYSNFIAKTAGVCVSNTLGPATLTTPPFTMRAISFTNPSWCGFCDGTITLYGLHPGQTDTISYTLGGVAQTPIVRTIGIDSQVVITGLCAGVYANFVAKTAGICISNTLGPVTLSTPPFTMRALTSTNPSWCGNCDGTITLYGLHPGQTDTITYTLGGVLQPSVIRVIPSDSQVVLTGLCAGVYANFVAKTGGVCISNTLGPVTLTTPAFTMRAITFTNPSWCGVCDGTITLYGLHPGDVDTINFTIGGIAQPPVVITIPSDSQAVLTGRCAGVYANFIASKAGGCVTNTLGPVTLTTPAFTVRALTFTNPSWCGVCDGSVTLYGLHPGDIDTIHFMIGGVAQPPRIVTIPSDSQAVLTAMCPGVYTNIYASKSGGCITNTLGPITLTTPPFTMRAVSFTNPSWCGVCDGTITLYGLHPGDIDSIHFNLGGIAQPSIIVTIPPDSQAVLTGMCAGIYTNFVAIKSGGCITNSLGPVTLTTPPFTVRSLTSVNPSWCGVCDGSITLYGLHPGDIDTIHFSLGGVPQPPVVITILADSQAIVTGLCAGVYSNIYAAKSGGCITNALGPVTLTAPPFTMSFLTSTNPDYCGICNGTVSLHGLHPGDIDTLRYTFNGAAQPPVVLTIPTDSQFVLTGLCFGVYNNFVISKSGGCVTNTLGPVTLTVPPFTMRALSHVNPDYCGICNGTITLYGLHPGQLDTITYTYNGVAQTPVVQLIPVDSQVTITGLCEGTYDNFVAHTAGVCVSNSLGPVTLTVPPFTMGYITFTNPTKCGFCDGIIKLHGLHPGQLDTINYSFNHIPQTPVSFLIGADSTVTISGLCEGTFDSFIAHTAGHCISNILGPVSLVWPPIIAGFSSSIHLGCGGDTVFFTNTSTPPADLTYRWYFGDGNTSTLTDPIDIYYSSGTYNVRLIITNTRCYDSTNHNITLNNLINAGFTSHPDSFICQDSIIYFNNTSTGTQLSYLWSFGDGTTTTATDPTHIFKNTGVYDIILAVKNYVPCFDTVHKKVTVDSTSDISISATDTVICIDGAITFTGNYSRGGNTGVIWNIGNSFVITNTDPVTYSFDSAGIYNIKLRAYYRACPDTGASRVVRVHGNPEINLGKDTSICPGSNPIILADHINSGNVNAQWFWSTGQVTPSIEINAPGEYFVKVSIYGCSTTDTIIVRNDCYIDIPNVFTPNGDGVNDYFFPRQYLSSGLTSFKLSIFNRWGQLIFETTNTEGRGWDGKYNGVDQPEGVYIYVIDAGFKDGQMTHRQGNITLLR